ncbi:hypothetical protein BDCR2A_01385 [Borrelia duttonii CR2A]|uniref:Uncharacterized protein n=1 Tax=Borrelia duttonii CR2A TaxID=1432657 RepID=W6TGU0_9SPIR|nr:hypothetical protein [Borrelia duttonii]ETZ17685.1 hypothetical protein BDCR2A_01385 [Borrelia duttonii CR2A]
MLIEGLEDAARSVDSIFTVHGASQPNYSYGIKEVFCQIEYFVLREFKRLYKV